MHTNFFFLSMMSYVQLNSFTFSIRWCNIKEGVRELVQQSEIRGIFENSGAFLRLPTRGSVLSRWGSVL